MKLNRIMNRLRSALRGPEHAARKAGVAIGADCRILSSISTSEPWLVSIGSRVTITGGVVFLTHDGTGFHVRDERGRRYRYAPITLDDDVFVGQNAILLPGVRIGRGSIVAAGSVVTKSIPPGVVVAGNPARLITTRAEFETRALSWPAKADMTGLTLREQIDSVAETEHRPEM
ncbi:acyltransferase [Microbacterium sp. CCNWLW134]|uniref:acyltransferase n=1 Tax=Microbacterium sp. CCNWLW134 TaxID=3122064 RepID=UPI00300F9272